MRLRTMIVDDEELAVDRLKMMLSEFDEIEIVHMTQNPWEAYQYAKEHRLELAFLDISMPELDGLRLASLLGEIDPDIRIVFATGFEEYAVRAFELSALDYVMKPVTARRMSLVLDKIRRRDRNAADGSFRPGPSPGNERSPGSGLLTEQEMRVMLLVFEGLSNKEIAARLNIAAETVKWHMKNVYRKLDVSNRVQLLRRAEQLHITF
ncbi:response regulator [Cohnella cellulosilytica]|uniref:Response regulator n=1 Tax=Cohnella cellulosilytica TaxID=986710 RepID=A0ABW2F7I2_9BACL